MEVDCVTHLHLRKIYVQRQFVMSNIRLIMIPRFINCAHFLGFMALWWYSENSISHENSMHNMLQVQP